MDAAFEYGLAAAIVFAEFAGLGMAAAVWEWKRWRTSSADLMTALASLPRAETKLGWSLAQVQLASAPTHDGLRLCTGGTASGGASSAGLTREKIGGCSRLERAA